MKLEGEREREREEGEREVGGERVGTRRRDVVELLGSLNKSQNWGINRGRNL